MPAPVAHETRCTARIRSSSHRERRRLRMKVGLVEDDELRPLAEAGAVGGELAVDHAVALVGVTLGCVDHVEQEPGPLEMGEELVPEPDALARPLDQARHVGDRELAAVGAVDRSEHRRERRERVVGDLRLRVRDPAQERRLAGVRQPRAGGVGHQLEVQLELERLSRQPGLGVARRLPRRRREVRVPAPAPTAACDDDPRLVLAQVGDERAVVGVVTCVPTGTVEHDVVAVGAVLARAAAVAAALRVEDRLGAERREVAQVRVGDDDDVAAAAAVAAVRPAFGHELLAAEAEAAVTAAARLDADACAIVEHAHSAHLCRWRLHALRHAPRGRAG